MKIWIGLGLASAFALMGCYTQLYTRGYAERTAYGYPYGPADSAGRDSTGDSLAAADTLRPPRTVIVNNYYQDSPYYRGYPIDAWDNPYFSLSLYSGRYRDYYGPYWWNDPYYRRGGGYHRRHYDDRPGGGGGGGASNPGPYRSDERIFAPAPSQPPLHKGRRSEPAPAPSQVAPAPKAADPQPAPAPAESSSNESGQGSGSSQSSGSSNSSGNDHPALHKGKRR